MRAEGRDLIIERLKKVKEFQGRVQMYITDDYQEVIRSRGTARSPSAFVRYAGISHGDADGDFNMNRMISFHVIIVSRERVPENPSNDFYALIDKCEQVVRGLEVGWQRIRIGLATEQVVNFPKGNIVISHQEYTGKEIQVPLGEDYEPLNPEEEEEEEGEEVET